MFASTGEGNVRKGREKIGTERIFARRFKSTEEKKRKD